jgi:hypothetical protein
MADDRRPHDHDDRAGIDVWLPAAVAIAAALFAIAGAHAETAPPRPIYDPARFDAAAIARETAEAAALRAGVAATDARRRAAVRVVALPVIETALVEDDPAAGAAAVAAPAPRADAAPGPAGWVRLLAPLAIAGLLLGALVGIGRVWQRTEPSLA